jgi:hypothetical protein
MGIRAGHRHRYYWPCGVILIKAHQAVKGVQLQFRAAVFTKFGSGVQHRTVSPATETGAEKEGQQD